MLDSVDERLVQTNQVYRYPGFDSFQDNDIDRQLFFGREEEKERLLYKILAERLVVLYGKSGMGKTSLLKAGVFQELRERKYIPLVVRLHESGKSQLDNFFESIDVDAYKNKHNKFLSDWYPGRLDTLWEYFKTAEFWSPSDELLTPVLILDQFEELFTRNTDTESQREFIKQLSDLVRGRTPLSVQNQIANDEEPQSPVPEYTSSPPDLKIVIAIREAHYGSLQILARKIPEIFDSRFRLEPLTRENARKAITEPAQKIFGDATFDKTGFKYTDDAVNEILDFLCGQKENSQDVKQFVEPFQLQLLCRNIEEKSKTKINRIINADDLGGKKGMQRILEDFYNDEIAALDARDRKNVQNLIENGLIKNKIRVPLHAASIKGDYNVSSDTLTALIEGRLLRAEQKREDYLYELSHDTLINPILDAKASREQKANKRRTISFACIAIFLGICLITTFLWLPKYFYKKGMNAVQHKDKISAFRIVTKLATKNDPSYQKAHYFLGKLIYEESARLTGDPKDAKIDEAVKHYETAAEKSDYFNANYELGNIYIEKKEVDKASEILERIANVGQLNLGNYVAIAESFFRMNNFDMGLRIYEIGVKKNPGNHKFTMAFGNALYAQRKFKETIPHYKQSIEENEALASDPNILENLAICYFNSQMYDEAIEVYEQLAVLVNKDKLPKGSNKRDKLNEIYFFKGQSYLDSQNFRAAIDQFEMALEINNNDSRALRGIANAYKKLGRPDKALEYEKRIKSLSAQNSGNDGMILRPI